MGNKLLAYFPIIKSRKEILAEIKEKAELRALFDTWDANRQSEFLDFVTGVRGVKMLYDFMFKEIMNPENAPERLEDLLTCLLGQTVKILHVLPNDSTRIADETSLLVTDIVVELEDKTIANIEVQKIGYAFPGERSACYSADLLLRQYKRLRSQSKKKFSYKDIRNVFTVVLFEKSPTEFHKFPEEYLHCFEQQSNTGLELNLLQKYLFIPLDIFCKIHQNKDIRNKLEAWLVFLSSDVPDEIISLINTYPEFMPFYRHVYEICQNMENVMELFSKELRELDRNTVQYMIDEMQEEINQQKTLLTQKDLQLEQQAQKIAELTQLLQSK